MELSRRETLALGLGAAFLTMIPLRANAAAEDAIAAFTGGADMVDGGVIFGTGFAPFRGGPLHYADSTSSSPPAALAEAAE